MKPTRLGSAAVAAALALAGVPSLAEAEEIHPMFTDLRRETGGDVDFFRSVGRPDLADSFARRYTMSRVLIYGGVVVEAVGILVLFRGLYESGFDTTAKIGLGLFAGGLFATGAGAVIQHPTTDEAEAADMVARYNQALGGHLAVSVSGRW